jgi:hypothetical protein
MPKKWAVVNKYRQFTPGLRAPFEDGEDRFFFDDRIHAEAVIWFLRAQAEAEAQWILMENDDRYYAKYTHVIARRLKDER